MVFKLLGLQRYCQPVFYVMAVLTLDWYKIPDCIQSRLIFKFSAHHQKPHKQTTIQQPIQHVSRTQTCRCRWCCRRWVLHLPSWWIAQGSRKAIRKYVLHCFRVIHKYRGRGILKNVQLLLKFEGVEEYTVHSLYEPSHDANLVQTMPRDSRPRLGQSCQARRRKQRHS